MAIGPETATLGRDIAETDLERLARRHLWLHFTQMGPYRENDLPIIVRGEGSYVWDEHGNRYLDGLSALFCVNAGHGRAEIGEAAKRQIEELGFYTNWTYAHPRAIELAAKIAELAPGDLNRVFFTSGGSEAVESAFKLVRQYHKLTGQPNRTKLIARETAYHGTTFGALTATGITALRSTFEPLVPSGRHVPNTNSYRWPADRDPLWAADAIEEAILFEGPETVAAVILEPVQNSGGCFTPQEGYFLALELVKDKETKAGFDAHERELLLRGFLSPELFRRGLICRADDRGEPVIQLSPPLVADTEEFDFMHDVLHPVLTEAWNRLVR